MRRITDIGERLPRSQLASSTREQPTLAYAWDADSSMRSPAKMPGKLANGGRFAHQRPHSIMDNADNTAVGYLNNAPVSHLAFILLSVGCSVFVAGSDIGPKVLGIMLGH